MNKEFIESIKYIEVDDEGKTKRITSKLCKAKDLQKKTSINAYYDQDTFFELNIRRLD